jgi:hypothetical protein
MRTQRSHAQRISCLREIKLLRDWTVLNGRCKEGVRYSESDQQGAESGERGSVL